MPPLGQAALAQSAGKVVSNSAEPGALARRTSPSSSAVRVRFASGVPCPKSACVVSTKVPEAVRKLWMSETAVLGTASADVAL